MVHVNLQNPEVQAKLKAAGIKWRMHDYSAGFLDIPTDKARELGITAVQLKAEVAAAEKAEIKADKEKVKAEKFAAEKAEEARADAKVAADKLAKEAAEAARAAADAGAFPVRIVGDPKKPK